MGADFQGHIEELQKKLEERDANQEHLETIFGGYITRAQNGRTTH